MPALGVDRVTRSVLDELGHPFHGVSGKVSLQIDHHAVESAVLGEPCPGDDRRHGAGCWTLTSSVLVGGFRVAGGSAEDETGGEPEGEGIGEVAVTAVSGVVEDDVTGCEVGLQPISRARGTNASGTRVRGTRCGSW